MKKSVIIVLMAFIFTSLGCNSDSRKVDVSKIQVEDVVINRFERVLFKNVDRDYQKTIPQISEEYWPFFKDVVLDSIYYSHIEMFVEDLAMQKIYQEAVRKFPNLTETEENLTQLMKYYKYHFPEAKIPKIYSYLSELNYEYPVKLIDSALIISLDMYLGNNFGAYDALGIPKYISRFYIPESIAVDCAYEMVYQYVKVKRLERNLLDEIVEQGKVLYAVNDLLPDVHDSLIVKYTLSQLEWCKEYESHIYNHLIEEELLFSTDNKQINPYFSEGPFTTAFSQSSPGRIGWWIGWQMVNKYMKDNPDVDLKSLLEETNSQMILNKSGYKPR